MANTPTTLFVFIDESGDMDFNAKASQHFLMSAIFTSLPGESAQAMQRLKYELLAEGSEHLEFHATNNPWEIRNRVITAVQQMDQFSAHTLWINKSYAHPSKQTKVELFALFGRAFGRWLAQVVGGNHDRVVMVFDSALTNKDQNAFKAAVKPALKATGVDFRLCFHPVKQDLNGQIADYYSWSAFRLLEANERTSADRLLKGAAEWTRFNLFQNGHTVYWQK
jgi:hypothetical protein